MLGKCKKEGRKGEREKGEGGIEIGTREKYRSRSESGKEGEN